MITKTKLGTLISAAAVSLGLALSASAQSADVTTTAPVVDDFASGLLGSHYAGFSYRYVDLDRGPATALRGVGLEFNQAWKPGIDVKLGYDWGRADAGPYRLTFQDLNVGATVFRQVDWGKPFAQALVGYEWQRGDVIYGNSLTYAIGLGAELQLASRFVLTPSVSYVRAVNTNRSEVDYGLKATYRINRQWGVSVGAQYNSVYHKADAKVFSVGVNYHY